LWRKPGQPSFSNTNVYALVLVNGGIFMGERLANIFEAKTYPIYDGYFLLVDPDTEAPVVAPNRIWVNQKYAMNNSSLDLINSGILSFKEGGRIKVGDMLASETTRTLTYFLTGGESSNFIFSDSNKKEMIKINAQRPRGTFGSHYNKVQYPIFQGYIRRFRQIEILKDRLGPLLKIGWNVIFPEFNWVGENVCSTKFYGGNIGLPQDFESLEKLISDFIKEQKRKSPGLWQGVKADVADPNFIVTKNGNYVWIDPLCKF